MATGDKIVNLDSLKALGDYTKGRLSELRSAMDGAGIGGNIVEPAWVNGSITLSNQALVYAESTALCVTEEGKQMVVDPGTTIHLTDPATYKYKAWYTGNNVKWYVLSSSYTSADTVLPSDKQRAYVIQVARNDGGAITPAELAGKVQLILPNPYPDTGAGLYKTFAAGDHLELSGALPSNTGGIATSNANWALTHFIPVKAGMRIAYGLTTTGSNYVICFYNSRLEYIANSGVDSGSGTVTVPADGFMRMSVDAGGAGNYVYFSGYQIPDQISRALAPIQDVMDNEAAGTAYMRAAVARITGQLKGLSAQGNLAVFGFNTDQHIKDEDDAGRTLPVLRGLKALSMLTREYPFDFVCLGGDACEAGNYATTVDLILDECVTVQKPLYDAWCPVVPLTGNHDAQQNNQGITGEMMFNVHFRRVANSGFLTGWDNSHTNGVWDAAAHQIRFVFFDDTIRGDYTQAARDAALTAMLAGTPEGYKIVILSHHPLSQSLENAKWQNPAACQGILHDYAGRIICCVCGHSHADVSEVSDGILYIGVNMAQFGTDQEEHGRVIDTEGETAYDVFAIDQANLKVYAFRYGYGESREWTYTLS